MAYSAKAVANELLNIAERNERSLDHMKLQKLVFYAHGWYLGLVGEPLLEEKVEAWQYGPVIPSLYHDLKEFGAGTVKRPALEYVDHSWQEPKIPRDDEFTHQLLEKIWKVYGDYSGLRLSDMTHQDGTPWAQARSGREKERRVSIDNRIIREYFQNLDESAS